MLYVGLNSWIPAENPPDYVVSIERAMRTFVQTEHFTVVDVAGVSVPRRFDMSATGARALPARRRVRREPRYQRGPVAAVPFEHLHSLNPMSPGVQTNGRARLTASPKGGALDQDARALQYRLAVSARARATVTCERTGSLLDLLAGASGLRPTS